MGECCAGDCLVPPSGTNGSGNWFTFMLLPLNSVNRQLGIPPYLNPFDSYSDSRNHGYQGSSRNVRLGRVIPSGGGALAKSDDGIRCAVTGKECR